MIIILAKICAENENADIHNNIVMHRGTYILSFAAMYYVVKLQTSEIEWENQVKLKF